MLAALLKDAYKAFHKHAYNPRVTHVYSNMTPRFGKHSNVPNSEGILFTGLQPALLDLAYIWRDHFFNLERDYVVAEYERVVGAMLGKKVDASHIGELHDLGYLPIKVKALPEGSFVNYGIPVYTIINTVSGFGWVTNMLETDMSAETWMQMTSSTTAFAYRKRFEQEPSLKASGMIKFMGHDFSYRGMPCREAAIKSGMGHLMSFVGSDTIPAALALENYYGASIDKELVFASVDATEHSVMCSYGTEGELDSLKHLINEVTPEGSISIVSDTWDFWKLVTEYLPALKEDIMARNGTVVIRPDSGDPVEILCGHEDAAFHPHDNQWRSRKGEVITEAEKKGLVECLYDTFGGTEVNGLKLLDSHIGAIYGDSITLARQDQIIKRLLAKGFVPSVVLGIGSYTYQYVTRDTHGTAVKATDTQHGEGNHVAIFKDPKTDSSKKSAKGLLMVVNTNGEYELVADVTPEQEDSAENCLVTVFENGELVKFQTLNEIRERIDANFE